MPCLLVLSLVGVASASGESPIPSEYAVNITVYHVNPYSEGVIPVNMDTADATGDIFFDFRSKVVPIECAKDPTSHDCTNPEVQANDLVITKLVLEVDKRFGEYGRCNVCVNGSAGGVPCKHEGDYLCACGGFRSTTPCPAAVGYENVTAHFGTRACRPGNADWECWRANVAKKTGGSWYSTTEKGYCGDGSSPPPKNCTWRVAEVVKVVNKTCSDNSVYNILEHYKPEATSCFSTCADSKLGPQRNTSSPCWIKCFYETVLGPDSGKPGGAVSGVDLDDLVRGWQKAFTSSEAKDGGCPALPRAQVGKCLHSKEGEVGPVKLGGRGGWFNQLCAKDNECFSGDVCKIPVQPESFSALAVVV